MTLCTWCARPFSDKKRARKHEKSCTMSYLIREEMRALKKKQGKKFDPKQAIAIAYSRIRQLAKRGY